MNTDINASLRAHQVEHSEALAVLHRHLRLIIDRFYPNVPLPALSFEQDRLGVLGTYREQDGLALCHRINLNTLYVDRPFADILRTIAHELGHLWQSLYGRPAKPPYHNKEFQDKMLELGIPCSSKGHSLGIQEPFVSFLKELGIETDLFLFKQEKLAIPRQSRSRLKPWSCGCVKAKVWASAGVVVVAACLKCSKLFQPQYAHLPIDILETLREVQKLIDKEPL